MVKWRAGLWFHIYIHALLTPLPLLPIPPPPPFPLPPPSSLQVSDTRPDANTEACSNRHQNFDVTSMASLKNKNITSIHVGGLDISRVQSDALPHSLLPSMITCEDGVGGGGGEGVEFRSDLPRMLEDAQSMDTASTEDTDRLSMTCSPLHAPSPLQSDSASPQLGHPTSPQLGHPTSPQHQPLLPGERKELAPRSPAEGSSSRGGQGGTSQAKRPMSAPNRSVSAGSSSPLHSSSASGGGGGGVGGGHVTSGHAYGREKRVSLDAERHKRMMNIQENARAALHYSAKRRSSRPEPLLQHHHRHASSTTSSSENDLSGSPAHSTTTTTTTTNPHNRHKSSPPSSSSSAAVHVLHQHNSSSTSESSAMPTRSLATPLESSATPLNLRQLSIDQTKKASLTQMDEIWRQVEAIGDGPSTRQPRPPLMSRTSNDTDESRNVVSSPSTTSDPECGVEYRTPFGKKQSSGVIVESDIVIAFDEPVDQSTPLRPHPSSLEVGGAAANGVLSLLETPENVGGSKNKDRPTSFSSRGELCVCVCTMHV